MLEGNEVLDNLSSELKDLLTRLLMVDPAERLTIEQAKKHPWFRRKIYPTRNSSNSLHSMNEIPNDEEKMNFKSFI